MLTVADIYCGAGGLSAGFELANEALSEPSNGFRIAYGVDRDPDAIRSFRDFHFSDRTPDELDRVAPCSDIAEISANKIIRAISPAKKVDVLIGGPNCQGVSGAGLRNPQDDRNLMLKRFIELVKDLSPSWFVIENVPGLTHSNNHDLLAEIFRELEEIGGYSVSGDVLLAADYGVPQFRYRLFIIGTNTGKPIRFPHPTHGPKRDVEQGDFLTPRSPYITVKDAIGWLKDETPLVYDRKSKPGQDRKEGEVKNHHYLEVGAVNKERIASIMPGDDWRSMPIRLLPERFFATRSSDQKGAYGRLLWQWPAYTVTNAVCNVTAGPFTHPEQNRMLSVREAALLQSFSKDHPFYGSLEAQYRQVGNAVPPKLAAAVGRSILLSQYELAEADEIGTVGRLNYDVIKKSLDGGRKFPTLVKRNVAPSERRHRVARSSKPSASAARKSGVASVWDSATAVADPHPEATRRLRVLANQPGNYRAAKRARAIVEFIDGTPKEKIVANANVSETSVKRWVDGYFAGGLDGWRAHHTKIDERFELDPKLVEKIAIAQKRVRRTLLSPTKNGGDPSDDFKRLHMNSYLAGLIKRFGDKSVESLTADVEEQLQKNIGTLYVGDLLALADVILNGKL